MKKIENYTSGIFNNCYYKFTNDKINIYNDEIIKINEIEAQYYLLANYCSKYYAIKKKDNQNIYILNNTYEEIDKIKLNYSKLDIISFTLFNNDIYILTKNKILKFDMQGNFISEELENINNIFEIKKNYINTLNNCIIEQSRKTINLTSIGVYKDKILVSFIKHNAAYIGTLLNKEIINIEYISDNAKIISIIDKCNRLEFLISKHDSYTYIMSKNCTTKMICSKNCCPKNCCPKKENNDNSIIGSISSIEYSLANILNKESCKIEKVLGITNNIHDIIDVNDSVTKMIKNITLLESILVEKLELALENK